MDSSDCRYGTYVKVLEKELKPAMGCTEPIAIAYCAAKARTVLGVMPEKAIIEVSGNIIKNAKSVKVPNTNGMKGIEAAVAVGVIAGNEELGLLVISEVTEEQKAEIPAFIKSVKPVVKVADSEFLLDIKVTLFNGNDSVTVRIVNEHTNVIYIEHNGDAIYEKSPEKKASNGDIDYNLLSIEGIYDFAQTVAISDIYDTINRQITYNSAISDEGLKNNYGANIGTLLLQTSSNDVRNRAKAKAAAGSDARMGGCELPVVINSGSGNQGMTVSLPVIEYAKELGASDETLYRALLISNLVSIHIKSKIGSLSAYCGAVSAGAAAGAAIAYLRNCGLDGISQTIVNTLAVTSGIVCDGAKASCAAKIATAVEAGILGNDMFINGQKFHGGDGIVNDDVERTILNIGLLGRDGMRETDKEILHIMTCFD